MNIETLVLGSLETNCYLVSASEEGAVLIIDPADKPETILQAVGERPIAGILLTHRHFDHIGALPGLLKARSAPVLVGERDADAVSTPEGNMSNMMGIPIVVDHIDYRLEEGDVLVLKENGLSVLSAEQSKEIGGQVESEAFARLTVWNTPGHTAGSISLIGEGVCFSGDLLFARDHGRTDLPSGSYQDIVHSLRRVLTTLPDETVVLSGHGPATTIGAEKRTHSALLT